MAHPQPHQGLNWGSIQHYKFLSSHLDPFKSLFLEEAGAGDSLWRANTGPKSPVLNSQGFPWMLSSPDDSHQKRT